MSHLYGLPQAIAGVLTANPDSSDFHASVYFDGEDEKDTL